MLLKEFGPHEFLIDRSYPLFVWYPYPANSTGHPPGQDQHSSMLWCKYISPTLLVYGRCYVIYLHTCKQPFINDGRISWILTQPQKIALGKVLISESGWIKRRLKQKCITVMSQDREGISHIQNIVKESNKALHYCIGFLVQWASNAENVSASWRHSGLLRGLLDINISRPAVCERHIPINFIKMYHIFNFIEWYFKGLLIISQH